MLEIEFKGRKIPFTFAGIVQPFSGLTGSGCVADHPKSS